MKQNAINKLIIITLSVLAIVFIMTMRKSSMYEGAVTISSKRTWNGSKNNYMDNNTYLKWGNRINSQDRSHYVRFIRGRFYVNKYTTDSDGEYVLKTNGRKKETRLWTRVLPHDAEVIHIGGAGTLLMSKGTNVDPLLTSGEHKPAVKLMLNNDGSLDLLSEQNKSVWSMGKGDLNGKLIEAMAGMEGLTVSDIIDERYKFQKDIHNELLIDGKANRALLYDAGTDLIPNTPTDLAIAFFGATPSDINSPDKSLPVITAGKSDIFTDEFEDSDLAGITKDGTTGDDILSNEADYERCNGKSEHELLLCNDRKMRRQRQKLDNKVMELNQLGDSHITEKGMQLDSTIYASLAWTVLASSLVFYAFTS